MEISAGSITNISPELNIGGLLQILNSFGLGQSSGTASGDSRASTEDFETILFQVFQQNVSEFMQSFQQENSADLTTKEDLLAVVEKLMREDRLAACALLSGLAMSALAPNPDGLQNNAAELIEGMNPQVMAETASGESGMKGDAIKIKGIVIPDENEALISKTMGLSPDKNINPEAVTPGLIAEYEAVDLSEQKTATVLRENPDQAHKGSSEKDNSAPVNNHDQTAKSTEKKTDSFHQVSNGSDRQRSVSESFKAQNSMTEQRMNTPSGPGDAQQTGASELKQSWAGAQGFQATPLKNIDRTLASERMTGENQSAKPVIFFQELFRDNSPAQNLVHDTPTEEKDLFNDSELTEQAQAVKKISGRPDVVQADKKISSLLDDSAKRDAAGKIAASYSDSVVAIEKVKTDSRSKTVTGEKNYDSNILNSPAAPGLNSAKTAVSDVSPAQMIDRITAQFTEMISSDGGRVKITLTPPSLGTLEMDVMVRNGSVKVMLIADSKEVQQMLSGHLDSLKGSLQNQGLIIEKCDVMMHDRREQYSQGFNQQQAFNHEQAAHHHYDEPEGYIQEKEEMNPIKIRPVNPLLGSAGKISLFV